jgi:phage repressor protein C with HTH and peptisase S24 domain
MRDVMRRLGRHGGSIAWLSRIETGARGITTEDLAELARVYGASVSQLIGEPERTDDRPRTFRQRLSEWLVDAPLEVPVYDQEAHAGFGPGAQILDYAYWAPARAAGRNIVAVKVRGDCLIPEVRPGDIVFIDREKAWRAGNLVVVSVLDELHICRVEKTRAGIVVFANNDGVYREDNARIEGVVIHIGRDVR